jgi:hypothetical protein
VIHRGNIYEFSELGSGWPQGVPRRQWRVLAKRRNTADDRFPARPKGASQMIHVGVAPFEKDPAISCRLRLVLDHLACSESINITSVDH